MTAAHLAVHGVHHTFGRRHVLTGIDALAQGGLITLLGANGAGKTTLLRCLSTVLRPGHGSIAVDGLSTQSERERIEIRRRLGYLPQHATFADRDRVFDALDQVAVLKGHTSERRRRVLVFDALDEVGLADRSTERVGALSGGMQRRLMLAQAVIGEPTLLVLDEPAAGLDPDERQRVRNVLAAHRRSRTTIVSTHLTDEAADADVIWVLSNGALVFADTPARLAAVADGRVWTQTEPPNAASIRSWWQQADGRYRCLGLPPPGAALEAPRLEDGYLLLT